MTHPFKVGDKVYHFIHGEVTIVEINSRSIVTFVDEDYRYDSLIESLSFDPWPKPNHNRPIQSGWWIVKLDGDYMLRWIKEGKAYSSIYQKISLYKLQEYELIKFITDKEVIDG